MSSFQSRGSPLLGIKRVLVRMKHGTTYDGSTCQQRPHESGVSLCLVSDQQSLLRRCSPLKLRTQNDVRILPNFWNTKCKQQLHFALVAINLTYTEHRNSGQLARNQILVQRTAKGNRLRLRHPLGQTVKGYACTQFTRI